MTASNSNATNSNASNSNASTPDRPEDRPRTHRLAKILVWIGALYIAHSAYLGVEAAPSLTYVASVFAHHFGGAALAIVFLLNAAAMLTFLPNSSFMKVISRWASSDPANHSIPA